MSRPPLRELYRLVHSGLEKVALACAAFGLMHATARAGESAPASLSTGDQWSSSASPQSAADDAWSNPAATSLDHDDAWSAPPADHFRSRGQLRAESPAPAPVSTQEPKPIPVATKTAQSSVAPTVKETPAALAMDRSGWNETPRGRSPGLIASNDAWLNRFEPVAEPTAQPKASVRNAPVRPADPWSAPATGLVAADNVVRPAAPFDASPHWSFPVSPYVWLPRVSGSTVCDQYGLLSFSYETTGNRQPGCAQKLGSTLLTTF